MTVDRTELRRLLDEATVEELRLRVNVYSHRTYVHKPKIHKKDCPACALKVLVDRANALPVLLDRLDALEAALTKAWLKCEHCNGLGRVPVALQGRPESSGMANCQRCKGNGYVRAALDTEQT